MMKSDDIPDYAKVYRRLTLSGWDYYVSTCYGGVAISKSVYNEVKLKKVKRLKQIKKKKYILRNS